MIKEITQYIEDEIPALVVGTDLFAGHVPIDVDDDAAVVMETPAGEVNFYLPDFRGKVVQVVCRSRSYLTAMDNAESIYGLLHGAAGILLPVVDAGPELWVNVIEALNPPGYIGLDERGFHEVTTNYIFRIQDN